MAKDRRQIFNMVCKVCGEYNYSTVRVRQSEEKLELNKYCPRCGCHQLHKEVKPRSNRK